MITQSLRGSRVRYCKAARTTVSILIFSNTNMPTLATHAQLQPIAPIEGRLTETTDNCRVWLPLYSAPPDPVIWTGQCKDGLGEGAGAIEYGPAHKRITFKGLLSNGSWNGPGTILYSDGRSLSSNWVYNRQNADVVYSRPDGSKYIGEWGEDRPNGRGTMFWANGTTYSGEWSNGQLDGDGEIRLTDGYTFKGSFVTGRFSGHGTLKSPDGETIEGIWRTEDVVDNAVVKDGQGNTYEGSIHLRKRDGDGTYKWADGREYHGHWVDNLPDGLGQYKISADTYSGTWHRGCLYLDNDTISIFVDNSTCDQREKLAK